jgi:putative polyhydroxyalkanoate system protein
MRINVPHHTDKETARKKINERIAHLFSQYGHFLSESEHKWEGDRLQFAGSAKGFKTNGTIEVTDTEVIIDGKLPLMAKPFEPRVKSAIEKEAAAMFA